MAVGRDTLFALAYAATGSCLTTELFFFDLV